MQTLRAMYFTASINISVLAHHGGL